jgi:L-lactate dehydrogenase complex protein LldG
MAATSRDKILNKLRAARDPFPDLPETPERKTVTRLEDASPAALRARFIEEATALKCNVQEAASDSDAVEIILDLLGDDDKTLMWDAAHIPVNGLPKALKAKGVQAADLRDRNARVGITGVDAALAATGSLVVTSGAGKSRQASLLPLEHIAVLKADRILPDIETYYANQSPEMIRENSNIAVISGPSKSADIAMTMIHGMHGPGKLHVIIVP